MGGGVVPKEVVETWRRTGGATKVIHQAEIYPAVVAVRMWANMLADRRAILFVDNEAAQGPS